MSPQIAAVFRAALLTDASYRMGMVASLLGITATTIPVYYIANALQPVVSEAISAQGGQYFAFVLVGMMSIQFVNSACTALPGAVSSGIRSGTLEALFATPTSAAVLFGGMVAYPLVWTLFRGVVLLTAGWVLGAQVAPEGIIPSLTILLLIILAYLPFGLIGTALLLVFRTTGPVLQGVVVLSMLLGGVYYPVEVIPEPLRFFSGFFPLSHGLRALRRSLLEGVPPWQLFGDIGVLLGFTVLGMAIGSVLLMWALHHARRHGTLAQY